LESLPGSLGCSVLLFASEALLNSFNRKVKIMKARCNLVARRVKGPDGKFFVLYIDVDGTLVACEPLFKRARANFSFLMQQCGFSPEEALELINTVDLRNAHAVGFERARFPQSMVETYRELCKQYGKEFVPQVADLCSYIGNSPFFVEPEVFPNAIPVLERLSEYFVLVAVTMGNREAQEYKIHQAGFGGLFDELIITPNDNKAECVRNSVIDMNVNTSLSAFIGNSPRSDGACLTETNFIHLPLEESWAFDQKALPENTGFEAFSAKSWREAEEIAARLIRRREYQEQRSRRRRKCGNP
jgi:putative hydrolase of the HAD superfamily